MRNHQPFFSLSVLGLLWLQAALIAQDGGEVAWERILPGDGIAYGRSVAEAHEGGVVIAGWTALIDLKEAHAYLVKIDKDGGVQWERSLGEGSDKDAWSVAKTGDGAYIVAGSTSFFAGDTISDFYLTKRDSDGQLIWQHTYGGTDPDYGRSAQETRDGGYIIVGWSAVFNLSHSEIYLVKTNNEGTVEWERRYEGLNGAQVSAVVEANDGSYLVCGVTNMDDWFPKRYLLKVDAEGKFLWDSTLGEGTGELTWVHPTATGSLVAGTMTAPDDRRLFIAELDDHGAVLGRTNLLEDLKSVDSVTVTSDGGFLLAGGYNLRDHNRTCALQIAKSDHYGQRLWDRSFVPVGHEACKAAAIRTEDGGYVMVGGTQEGLYIVKLLRESPNPLLFIRGDADGDGKRDITDPIGILNHLFLGGPEPLCADAEDSNDDGAIDVADAIYLLHYLFTGGELPPIPCAFCGLDPTDDEIYCQGQPSCTSQEK